MSYMCPWCNGVGRFKQLPPANYQDLFDAVKGSGGYMSHEFDGLDHSIVILVEGIELNYSERHEGDSFDKVIADATASLVVALDAQGECPKCGGSGGGPDPENQCPRCHGGG